MKHSEVQTPAAPTKPNKYILRIASAFAHTTFRGSSTCSTCKTKLIHSQKCMNILLIKHSKVSTTFLHTNMLPSSWNSPDTLHSSTQPKHRGSKSIEPIKCRCLVFFVSTCAYQCRNNTMEAVAIKWGHQHLHSDKLSLIKNWKTTKTDLTKVSSTIQHNAMPEL
jgi:hypothetical protein